MWARTPTHWHLAKVSVPLLGKLSIQILPYDASSRPLALSFLNRVLRLVELYWWRSRGVYGRRLPCSLLYLDILISDSLVITATLALPPFWSFTTTVLLSLPRLLFLSHSPPFYRYPILALCCLAFVRIVLVSLPFRTLLDALGRPNTAFSTHLVSSSNTRRYDFRWTYAIVRGAWNFLVVFVCLCAYVCFSLWGLTRPRAAKRRVSKFKTHAHVLLMLLLRKLYSSAIVDSIIILPPSTVAGRTVAADVRWAVVKVKKPKMNVNGR